MNKERMKAFLEFFKSQKDFDWVVPLACIVGKMAKFTGLDTRLELSGFFEIKEVHLMCIYWMRIEGLVSTDLTHEHAIEFLEDYIEGKYQYDPVQSFLVKNK